MGEHALYERCAVNEEPIVRAIFARANVDSQFTADMLLTLSKRGYASRVSGLASHELSPLLLLIHRGYVAIDMGPSSMAVFVQITEAGRKLVALARDESMRVLHQPTASPKVPT